MMRLAAVMVGIAAGACGAGPVHLTELERAKSGTLQVVLLSDHDALRHGKDTFFIEFRADPGGTLMDVGTVKATASMPMPGMPMFGGIDVRHSDLPGRYAATGEFSMAGRWRIAVEWDGPAGRGSVSFSGSVQ